MSGTFTSENFHANNAITIGTDNVHGQLRVSSGSTENALTVLNGKVGVNKFSSEYELEVKGTVQATKFQGDGSQLSNITILAGLDWKVQNSRFENSNIIIGSNTYNLGSNISTNDFLQNLGISDLQNVTLASVPDNYLTITGQEITAGTVPISLGGTGGTNVTAARTNLGLGTMAQQNRGDVTITGGTITEISFFHSSGNISIANDKFYKGNGSFLTGVTANANILNFSIQNNKLVNSNIDIGGTDYVLVQLLVILILEII